MEIGIIGLPKSGKTTIFNLLTHGKAETAPYPKATLEPNIGVAKVEDPRLTKLVAIFNPKKTIPAEIKYIDIAVPRQPTKGEGLSGELLNYLGKVDALLEIVRAFPSEEVPHIEGSIDPPRDIATMDLELTFSDLAILERRLKRIEESLKKVKGGSREQQTILQEQALLAKLKVELEKEMPIREQGLTKEELELIKNYQFLTAKPLIIALNIGEGQLAETAQLQAELQQDYPKIPIVALCGQLEMELSQLTEEEAQELRPALGIEEAAVERLVRASYQLLGLISFFTTVSAELKAWTVAQDTPAIKAAGKIHSDMERGFIRAEVAKYQDLIEYGSLAELKRHGLLRLEGKNYPIQDGDIITFLFNV
jgi:hypothetical protein